MYTMKEVCQISGLSYDTLKYYCNEGLIPNVKRDKNNRRIFDERDLSWLNNLICLKNCGMSISGIKNYLQYCLEGEKSIPTRMDVLNDQREVLLSKIKELEKNIEYIDQKQTFYQEVLDGKIKYRSDLIKVD